MDERDRRLFGILIDHATVALAYAHRRGRDWWQNNETLDAILMRVSQVGEVATRISPEGLTEVRGVTWRDVKGMRSRIVHDSEEIDMTIIRGVVSRQLPALVRSVRRALNDDDKRRDR